MPNIFSMLRKPSPKPAHAFAAYGNATPTPAANVNGYILRDQYTHHEIARGPKSDMLALQAAFGLCYIEAI